MYCRNCGTKLSKGDKFCSCCGTKIIESANKKPKVDDSIVKKISLTALDLFSAEGDKWRKNTELLPNDCWVLLLNTSKGQASSFIKKHNLEKGKAFLEKLERDFFTANSYGIWIWAAEKKQTDVAIFDGRIKFNYDDVTKDSLKFITKWEVLLDDLDNLIPEQVQLSFTIAQKKMEVNIDNDNKLRHLTAEQLWYLKSDLLGSIYRGYLLHKFFK